jgi:hypothetical protein
MFIPVINPKAFILRKHLNEALRQDAYNAKIITPDWKKTENETFTECVLSETPLESKSRHMLLLILPSKIGYLYNPASGCFYMFGRIYYPLNLLTCVFDVQVYDHTLYIRDVYVWDNIFIADLYFKDRKQICDIITLHINCENKSWIFLPCKYIYTTKEKKEKLYYILLTTYDEILLQLSPEKSETSIIP